MALTLVTESPPSDAKAAAAMKLAAKVLRGVVALYKKDYTVAEANFGEAHLQDTTNFAASNNYALALCEQNDDVKKKLPWTSPRRTPRSIRGWRKPTRPTAACSTASTCWTRPTR